MFSLGQWLSITVSNYTVFLFFEAAAYAVILVMNWKSFRQKGFRSWMPWPLTLFLTWVAMSAMYGVYMAEGYWDYKLLVTNIFVFMMPLFYPYLCQPSKTQVTLRVLALSSIPVFFVLLPFIQGEGIGRMLTVFSFLLVLFPLMDRKARIFVLVVSSMVFIVGTFGSRSSIVKFLFCGMLGVAVIFRNLFDRRLLSAAMAAEFILPVVLLVLGLLGIFNPFQIDEYFKGASFEVESAFDKGETEDISADTRTFIYVEEITSAIMHNYVVQGHSLARGYESQAFGDTDEMGRGQRQDSEVSILNVFNYMGLIGVVLYAIIFIYAMWSVCHRSRNKAMYFVAIYVGFRWMFAFFEDYNRVDMNNVILWMSIAMCCSRHFLEMDDRQFTNWVRNIIKL